MGKSFEERQVTLERGDSEPWEGGGEEEGRLHVSFPSLPPDGGWSSYQGGGPLLFSLRIKAPFTGSVKKKKKYQSGWLLSKSLQAINAGEGVEKREPSYTVVGNAN